MSHPVRALTRRGLAVGAAVVLALTLQPPVARASGLCLFPPTSAAVRDPFRAPDCPYCAGNRGIEYAPTAGSAVLAPAAGTVTFSGVVAGVRYVVVDIGGGYRVTAGRLASAAVRAGDRVAAGQVIATTTESFFLGLRSGETYLDPAPFLASLVPRPQLVPLDGSHRRPPRPARLACP